MVAERGLLLLHNKTFLALVAAFQEELLPPLIDALLENIQPTNERVHWHK